MDARSSSSSGGGGAARSPSSAHAASAAAASVSSMRPATPPPAALDAHCPSCPPSSVRLSVHSLGSSIRCTSCNAALSECVREPVLQSVPQEHTRWDTGQGRQQMVLVTLPCDRPPVVTDTRGKAGEEQKQSSSTTAASSSAASAATPLSGLARHSFTSLDLQHDPLASNHFVTAFDVFECTSWLTTLSAAAQIPPDAIEMQLAMDQASIERNAEEQELQDEDLAAAAVKEEEEEQKVATSSPIPASFPAVKIERSASTAAAGAAASAAAAAKRDEALLREEERATARSILQRNLSAFVKSSAGAAGGASAASPADKRDSSSTTDKQQQRLQSSLSQGATPFSAVKEETLSDMEVASDVSRAASGAPAAATGATGRATSSASEIVAAAAAAASASAGVPKRSPSSTLLVPGVVPSPSPVSPLPASTPPPASASALEEQLGAFVGLDPLSAMESSLPSLPPLPNSQEDDSLMRAGSLLGAPHRSSSNLNIGLGGQQLPVDAGLVSATSAYLLQAQLGLETEAPGATVQRSFSLMAQTLAADFSGVGAGGAHASGGGGSQGLGTAGRGMSSLGFGLAASPSSTGAAVASSPSRTGSSGGGGLMDFGLPPSRAGSFGLLLQPAQSFSGLGRMGSMGGSNANAFFATSRTESFRRLENSSIPGVVPVLAEASFISEFNAVEREADHARRRVARQREEHAQAQQRQQQLQMLSRAPSLFQFEADYQQHQHQHQHQHQQQNLNQQQHSQGESSGGERMLDSPIPRSLSMDIDSGEQQLFGSQGSRSVSFQRLGSGSGSGARAAGGSGGGNGPRTAGGSGGCSQPSLPYGSGSQQLDMEDAPQVGSGLLTRLPSDDMAFFGSSGVVGGALIPGASPPPPAVAASSSSRAGVRPSPTGSPPPPSSYPPPSGASLSGGPSHGWRGSHNLLTSAAARQLDADIVTQLHMSRAGAAAAAAAVAAAGLTAWRSPSPAAASPDTSARGAGGAGGSIGQSHAQRIAQMLLLLGVSSALRDHMSDFCTRLSTPPRVARVAGHIAREMQRNSLGSSRESSSLCVTALYAAYKLENVAATAVPHGPPLTQKEFCKLLGRTEVTMRKILKGDIAPRWPSLVWPEYEPVAVPDGWVPAPARPSGAGGAGSNAGRPKKILPGDAPPPERSASSVIHALHGEMKERVLAGGGAATLQQQQQYQLETYEPSPPPGSMGPPAPRAPGLISRLGSSSSFSRVPGLLSVRPLPPGFLRLTAPLRLHSSPAADSQSGSPRAQVGEIRFHAPLPYTPDGLARIHVYLKKKGQDRRGGGEPRLQPVPSDAGAATAAAGGASSVAADATIPAAQAQTLQAPSSPAVAPTAAASAAAAAAAAPRPRARRTNLPLAAREANSDSSTDEEEDTMRARLAREAKEVRTAPTAATSSAAAAGAPPLKRTKTLLCSAPDGVPIQLSRPPAHMLLSQSNLTRMIAARQ